MTDVSPSISTFDIAQVLMGRGYPETEVPFYLDEATAVEISRAEKNLTHLGLLQKDTEYAAEEKRLAELKEKLRKDQFTYHLRGVPNKTRQDVLKKAFEKYPKKIDAFGLGGIDENDERDQFYTNLLWQAMTVKIVSPDGQVQVHPTLEVIEQFRDYAPAAALSAIDDAIQELSVGAKAGFEAASRDADFLSQP